MAQENVETEDMTDALQSMSEGLHDIASSLDRDHSADKRMLIDSVDGIKKGLMEVAGAIKYRTDMELIRELATADPKHLEKIERLMAIIDKKRLTNDWLD